MRASSEPSVLAWAVWAAGFWLIAGAPARSQALPLTRSVTIDADTLEHRKEPDRILARGRVRVEQGPFVLTGDEALYDRTDGWVDVRGHVRLTDGYDTVDAEAMEYFPRTGTGVLWGATVTSPAQRFRMTGRRVERAGPDHYRVERGTFTTCLCPCPRGPTAGAASTGLASGATQACSYTPPWAFSGTDVDVEVGGYATARNVVFWTGGLPAFWLPWAAFPVKTHRETGLLIPSLDYSSRDGFEPEIPFYWAIAPNADATLTAEMRTSRGWGGEGEARYIVSRSVRGEARGLLLDESFLPKGQRAGADGKRWSGDVWLDASAGEWGMAKGEVRQVGDPLVLQDLSKSLVMRAFGFDETEGFLQVGGSRTLLRLEARSFQQLVTDPVPTSSDPLRRLPRVTLESNGEVIPGTPLAFSLRSAWDRFDRRGATPYDDLNGTGVFVQGATGPSAVADPVRTGDRLLVTPTLEAPFNPGGVVQIRPRVTATGRLYDLPVGEPRTFQESSVGGALSVSTLLGRSYPLPGTLQTSLVHTLLPEFSLEYATQAPLLLRGIAPPEGAATPLPGLDPEDVQAPFSGAAAGLTSFLLVHRGGSTTTFLRAHVETRYDFREASRSLNGPQDVRHPWGVVLGQLDATPMAGARVAPSAYTRVQYDPNQKSFTRFENIVGLADPRGDSIGGSYNVTPAGPGGYPPLGQDWSAAAVLNVAGRLLLSGAVYSASGGLTAPDQLGLQSVSGSVQYTSACACWDVLAKAVYSPVYQEKWAFQVLFNLTGVWGIESTGLPNQSGTGPPAPPLP